MKYGGASYRLHQKFAFPCEIKKTNMATLCQHSALLFP